MADDAVQAAAAAMAAASLTAPTAQATQATQGASQPPDEATEAMQADSSATAAAAAGSQTTQAEQGAPQPPDGAIQAMQAAAAATAENSQLGHGVQSAPLPTDNSMQAMQAASAAAAAVSQFVPLVRGTPVRADDDPESELNSLRREVRRLQAAVRNASLQASVQEDELIELRMKNDAAQAREAKLMDRLDVERRQVKSTMAAAEALVKNLKTLSDDTLDASAFIDGLDEQEGEDAHENALLAQDLDDPLSGCADRAGFASHALFGEDHPAVSAPSLGVLDRYSGARAGRMSMPLRARQDWLEGQAVQGESSNIPRPSSQRINMPPFDREIIDSYRNLGPMSSTASTESPQASDDERAAQAAADIGRVRSPLGELIGNTETTQPRVITATGVPLPSSPPLAPLSVLPGTVEALDGIASGAAGSTRAEIHVVAGGRRATPPITEAQLPTAMAFGVRSVHEGDILTIAGARDGTVVASGGADRWVRVFDPSARRTTAMLTHSTRAVTALDFDPTSCILAAGSQDGYVRLWRRDPRRRTRWNLDTMLSSHAAPVRAAVFDTLAPTDAPRLYTVSLDRSIKLTDLTAGKRPFVLNSPSPVLDMDVMPSSGVVVSAHRDGGLRAWSARDGPTPVADAVKAHSRAATSVTCLDDGFGVVSLGRDRVLKLSDARVSLAHAVRTIRSDIHVASDYQKHTTSGRFVACGLTPTGTVGLWNVDSGRLARPLVPENSAADVDDVLGLFTGTAPGAAVLSLWTPRALVTAHQSRSVAYWS